MTRVTQAHVDARTISIRDAAIKLFIERGADNVTMQDVAGEAGLSAGAIYRYFPNKEQLIRDVFAHCAAMTQEAYNASEGATSPLGALRIIGETIWARMVTAEGRRETAVALETALDEYRASQENRDALRGAMRLETAEKMEKLVRAGQAAGEIDPSLDPRAMAMMLPALAVGMQFFTLTGDHDVDPDAVLDLILQILTRGAKQG